MRCRHIHHERYVVQCTCTTTTKRANEITWPYGMNRIESGPRKEMEARLQRTWWCVAVVVVVEVGLG
jgi:hypothetical protein